jgi:hypothetical protein
VRGDDEQPGRQVPQVAAVGANGLVCSYPHGPVFGGEPDSTVGRSPGYLPALASVLNALWVVLWHFEAFVLTVPVMLGLLLTLIALHVKLRSARAATGPTRWLVALPFSVYLGWITVATIANISQMLYWAGYLGEPLGEGLWAVIVLGTGLAIAVIMLLREADWAFGLVIVWAYVGIAVQQEEIIAVVSAVVGAFIVAATVGYVLRQRRVAVAGSPALQRRQVSVARCGPVSAAT